MCVSIVACLNVLEWVSDDNGYTCADFDQSTAECITDGTESGVAADGHTYTANQAWYTFIVISVLHFHVKVVRCRLR